MKTVETFATPIWTEHLESLRTFLPAWLEHIRTAREQSTRNVAQRSTRKGWHSDRALLEQRLFEPLKASVIEAARLIFKDYGVNPEDRVLSIVGWANVHDRGGHNVPHSHPGSWVSGTVYLSTPEGSGRLYFRDPRPAAVNEGIPLVRESERPTSPLRARELIYVQPRELMLIAFPGWLEHGVEICESEDRVSVAFNISPVHRTNA